MSDAQAFGQTQADGGYLVTGVTPGANSVCFQDTGPAGRLPECWDDVPYGQPPSVRSLGAGEAVTLPPVTLAEQPGPDAFEPGDDWLTARRFLGCDGDALAAGGYLLNVSGWQQDQPGSGAYTLALKLYPCDDDADGDGVGDACDLDWENDGFDSADDNCPMVADPLRTDNDGDGIGDLCDTCPRFANPNQADTDRDGLGDDCDNCPRLANADQADTLGDGVGDVCRFCQQCMTGRGGWRSVIGR